MNPTLAIVAYPILSVEDRATIQAVRAEHDPQFVLLDPHFTLVFPVEAPLDQVVVEVRSAAGAAAPFSVTLESVQAVPDVFGAGGYVFLVPGQGAHELAVLNSKLYSGALAWACRADIPYVPHITVARSADFSACEVLATRLARDRWVLTGAVESLSVVEIGSAVTTRANALLGAAGPATD